MTSKKRHQKVADQFKELNAKLNKKKDEYLEKISKNINKAVKNYEDKKQWKQYYNEIVNLFYAVLTDTYLLTAIALKEIYGQISDNIPNIEDFLYTEDDKTLPERLKQYWDEALSLLKNSQTDPQEIALYLLSMYDRILTTEMQNVKTGVKQTKKPIRETDIEVIIITDGQCCTHGGIYLAADDPELPPYHPNCQCDWWIDFYDPNEEQDLEVLQEAGWEEDDG